MAPEGASPQRIAHLWGSRRATQHGCWDCSRGVHCNVSQRSLGELAFAVSREVRFFPLNLSCLGFRPMGALTTRGCPRNIQRAMGYLQCSADQQGSGIGNLLELQVNSLSWSVRVTGVATIWSVGLVCNSPLPAGSSGPMHGSLRVEVLEPGPVSKSTSI